MNESKFHEKFCIFINKSFQKYLTVNCVEGFVIEGGFECHQHYYFD